MRAVFILPAIVLASVLGGAACGGSDDGPTDEQIRQVLQAMVLQSADIPSGLQPLTPSFSDNAQAASGLGSRTKEQLDASGRILGYTSEYQAAEPGPASAPVRVQSDVTLYKTEQGATDSFNERVARARAADWQASHPGLSDFKQEEVTRDLGADGSYWLHLTGYQTTGPAEMRLVSDDQIVFRVGRVTGFLNVVSEGAVGVDDRNFIAAEVETLARKQVQHTREGLKSGLLD